MVIFDQVIMLYCSQYYISIIAEIIKDYRGPVTSSIEEKEFKIRKVQAYDPLFCLERVVRLLFSCLSIIKLKNTPETERCFMRFI